MKILLVVHQFFPEHYGGTEQLTRHTGLELLARGHEVHVLTGGGGSGGRHVGMSTKDYYHQGLRVHAIATPRSRGDLEQIRNEYTDELVARHVRRYVERLEPDVVHVWDLFNLSEALLEVFAEPGVPVAFTATSFWLFGALLEVFAELDAPMVATPTSFWPVNKTMLPAKPFEDLPEVPDKHEFYRALARRALSEPQNEQLEPVRGMLERNRYLRERFGRFVDVILSPNEFMSRTLTTYGIDPGLIHLFPYGIDTSGLERARTSRPESGELRVGFVGTITRPKGLHVLIEAFKMPPRENGATLRICGELDGRSDYACEVYELAGGEPRINFAGSFPNEEMAVELGEIDVLVVPPVWHENTPLVVHFASAAGIPVVASRTEGLKTIVRHEVNGLLFEPGSAEDLAGQLRRLQEEPGLLEELGSRTNKPRSVEDSVDEMLALYERLRERKARQGERARKARRSTDEWLWLNYEGIKENLALKRFVAPFPPAELMQIVSAFTDELDFAAQGVHIYEALLEASPVPWEELPVILDFGCGCGRVARLFEDQGLDLHGVDIDARHIDWLRSNLPYVKAVAKESSDPLPYPDDAFDAIYSISVFTHVDEEYHETQLAELARISKPGALLFLTISGERVLERAINEKAIKDLINVDEHLFWEAVAGFREGGYTFVPQRDVYLNTDEYDYGITFIPASYVHRNWSKWFEVIEIRRGDLYDFQDTVVLRAKAEKLSYVP